MSKANNAAYGTSYIPPNQLGDADAIASQIVFQGISTLSSFQFVQSGDYLQMFAVSPTLPPLFTTETYIPAYTSVAEVIGRTQHMGINDSNTEVLSDLDMNNNNILNVNEIDVQDVNLNGHHLTTDSNGDLLIDGASADAKWYVNPVPPGSNVKFLSANPLSLINTLYTPNGTDLWYNNVNLTSGGGGGGGGEDWATYPANSNVLIPSPYGLSVGANAPIATFPTITLCGNTTIGRASIIPFNAPDVEIYPYNFNVGSKAYPAYDIDMNAGLGGITLQSATTIDSEALLDVNLTAGGLITIEAIADVNILAAIFSVESGDTNIATGAYTAECGTIAETAITSIIETAPLVEINGADFNVLSVATSIESATTAITSGAVVITGTATANVISPLTTITGAVLALQSINTNITSQTTNISGTNVNILPTNQITIGSYQPGNIGTTTQIAGNNISFNTLNPIQVNTGAGGLTMVNNAPIKVGVITDWNGGLNIRSQNASIDVVSLCNVVYMNSVNGTFLNNIRTLNCQVAPGMGISNVNNITFIQKPNVGAISYVSSITGGGGQGDLSIDATDFLVNVASDIVLDATQVSIKGSTEIDLNSPSGAIHLNTTTITENSGTHTIQTGTLSNLTTGNTYFNTVGSFNVNAQSINFTTPPAYPPTSMTVPLINARNVNLSTINSNVGFGENGILLNASSITSFMNTNPLTYNISSPNVYIEVGSAGLDVRGNVQIIGEIQTYVPSKNNYFGLRQENQIENTIVWSYDAGLVGWTSQSINPIGDGTYLSADWIPIVSVGGFIAPSQASGLISITASASVIGGTVCGVSRYLAIKSPSPPVSGSFTCSILMMPKGFSS